jgi:hypothetical protein
MSCGTVSGFETPLVTTYAVGEGVTRERESVNEAATRRNSDTMLAALVSRHLPHHSRRRAGARATPTVHDALVKSKPSTMIAHAPLP